MSPEDEKIKEMQFSAAMDGESDSQQDFPEYWKDLRQHLQKSEDVQPPDADWMFARIQQEIKHEVDSPEKGRTATWLKWAAAGVVFLGVMALFLPNSTISEEEGGVLWVETHLPDSSSIVYEDTETGITVIWMVSEEDV